jgi:hypothetical protein
MYNPESIMGLRIASAPFEDLIFGFAMILATMTVWEKLLKQHKANQSG